MFSPLNLLSFGIHCHFPRPLNVRFNKPYNLTSNGLECSQYSQKQFGNLFHWNFHCLSETLPFNLMKISIIAHERILFCTIEIQHLFFSVEMWRNNFFHYYIRKFKVISKFGRSRYGNLIMFVLLSLHQKVIYIFFPSFFSCSVEKHCFHGLA